MGPSGVNIFDGFGNAGMGVPRLPQQQQQQYDAKPYDIKPYQNERVEDVTSPIHPHQHNQQHTPQQPLLGQEPLPPFQTKHQQQPQQPQTPAPYQSMHTPLDYAPLGDYGFMSNPRTAPQQKQMPGMGVRQGSLVFGHHPQQQGQQQQGLGLVGVGEHLQYR